MTLQKPIDRDAIHPTRLALRWPAWADAVRRQSSNWGSALTEGEAEGLQISLQKAYQNAIAQVDVGLRPKSSHHFFQVYERSIRFGMLHSTGFNIILMSPAMRAAISRTSLEGVRVGDLQMPFRSLYIGFEGGSGVKFIDGPRTWVNDGAYISETISHPDDPEGSRRFDVSLTSRDPVGHLRPEWEKAWVCEREPHITLHLVGMPDETIEQALGHALANGEIDLEVDEEQVNGLREDIVNAREAAAVAGIDLRAPVETASEWRVRFNQENLASARKGLGMALGALSVMIARRAEDDVEDRVWSADAPANLVQAAELGETPKIRRKARGDLLRAGYVNFRHLDFDAPSGHAPQDIATGTPGAKRAHWRRGHIRRQPYGPGRSNHKLVWIRPQIINADAGEPAGRVTRVSRHGD